MTDNPTTDPVTAAVEKLRDLALMSGPEDSYYRRAFAGVEAELTRLRARVGDLESAIAKWKIEEGEWIAENTQLRADLAALVPLAEGLLGNETKYCLTDEEVAAASAALARVEARQ